MVGIITGKGTGLERSSAWVLGSQGQLGSAGLGRDGESVFVNAANGNLVVTRQDEFLIGLGPDVSIGRTYNSQSAIDGDNNDNWRASVYRKVIDLTGTYGTVGSTVKRIDWDGSETLYTWKATHGAYVATDGAGAYDTLTRSGDIWTWTDGNSRVTELYDQAKTGLITTTSDPDGNSLTYTYDAANGLITSVTSLNGSGTDETVDLTYNLANKQLTKLVTTKADGTITRIFYDYDGYGRLSAVKVNLDPGDNSATTGAKYLTTYTYHGTSTRVASIGQQDGSLLEISYVQDGSVYRVSSYAQTIAAGVVRTTSFDYGIAGRTTVTDPAGQKTVMFHDQDGNLTAIAYPADSLAPAKLVQFAYNSNGDVISATHGPGNIVSYAYDLSGNLVTERDGAGNEVRRTYGARNELLSEIRTLDWSPTVPTSSFESPPVAGGWVVNPTISGTTFASTAGITGNGSAFSFTYAPEGSQYGYIQSTPGVTPGSISQTIGGLKEGRHYVVSFAMAARPIYGGNPIIVSFNGTALGTYTPGSTNFETITVGFIATGATGTIAFTGTAAATDQSTAFDSVRVAEVETTRYLYDGENHLRFVVSAAGHVTQHIYDGPGNRTATIDYALNLYDVAEVRPTQAVPLSDLETWVNGVDKSRTVRTQYTHDHRGNVITAKSYSKLLTDGTFDTSSDKSETTYVYDGAGNLLSRVSNASAAAETFLYDGLNRMTMATDFNANVTRTIFADALGQTVVTHANGLSEISTYNRGGELVAYSKSEAGANLVDLGGWPGDPGNLPSGYATLPGWQNNPTYYDETRWQNTIGPDGLPVAAIQAGQLDTTGEGGGSYTNEVAIDGSKAYEFVYYFKFSELDKHNVYFGLSQSGGGAYVENATFGGDNSNPYFYVAPWNAQSTTYTADKWYKLVGYVLPEGSAAVPWGSLGGVYDVATGQKVVDVDAIYRWNAERPTNSVHARFFDFDNVHNLDYSTYFYQPEIRQVTAPISVAPDTSTSLYRYDNLGRLRMTVDPTGRRQHMMYDNVGRKIADIDADGSVIEYRYDGSDNLTGTTRYATRLSAGQLAALVDGNGNPTNAALSTLRPASHADDQWTFQAYDAAQRLVQTIDGTGATTAMAYDGASRLVSTRTYANRLSATVLTDLKARAATPNHWSNPANGTLWSRANLNVTAADPIDNVAATKFTVINGAAFQAVSGDGITAGAGDTVSLTLWLKAVGTLTVAEVGLWGYSSGGGANADSVAFVTSGPGAVTGQGGGLFQFSGLSTTTATRITIRRTVAVGDVVVPFFYVKGANLSVVAGDSLIVAAPVLTWTDATPLILPAADAANDRLERSFYDGDGRLIGTLDGEGNLAQIFYDGSGRKLKTTAYSDPTTAGIRATGTFLELYDSITPDDDDDIHTHLIHDARGLLRATVDGEGNLTRYHYTPLGDVDQIVTGQELAPADLLTTPPTLANLPAAAAGTILQTTTLTLDHYGKALTETKSLTGAANTVTQYSYDSMGRLTRMVTQSGGADPRTMTRRYDLRGRLTGTLDGAANAALGGSPTQAQIDAAYANHGATFVYDKADRMISSTDANGARSLHYYDPDGRLAFQVDALGETVEYRYDTFGARSDVIVYAARIASATLGGMKGGRINSAAAATFAGLANAALDQASHVDFNVDGSVKQSSDPLGQLTTYAYNAFGELSAQVDPLGDATTRASSRTYDRRGLLKISVVDSESGHKQIATSYGYDAFGRLVLLTNPNNQPTSFTYDRAGRLATSTDAAGKVTAFSYDARGNLVTTTDGVGTVYPRVTRYVYDHGGRQTWAVDAVGGVVRTSYDDDGRVLVTKAYATAISLTGLAPQATEADLVARVADHAKDRITRNAYDRDGRLRFVVDGVSALTEYGYDDAGNVIRSIAYGSSIDATTNYTIAYIEGQIASKGLAALAQTRVSRAVYDAAGRTVFAIAADNSITQFVHDSAGRIVKQRVYADQTYAAGGDPTEADMAAWASTHATADDQISRAIYDRKGQLNYSVDAEGYVTKFTYDRLGSITKQIRYATAYTVGDATTKADMDAAVTGTIPATAAVTKFEYDSAGRLEKTTDPMNFVTVLTRDQLGEVLTSTAAHGTAHASTTTYTHDAVGRVLSTRVQVDSNTAHDLVTTNGYDAFGDLVKVIDARGNTHYNYYDPVGRLAIQTDPEKHVTKYFYTAFGEVEAVLRHELIASNSPTETFHPQVPAHAGDAVTSFTYDRRGRLLSTTDAENVTESYGLDEFGNRTSLTNKLGHTITYTYDKLNRMKSETLPVDVVQASDGTVLATSVTNEFSYDSRGNLEWKIEAANRPPAERRTTFHVYDKLDRLTRKVHDAVTVLDGNFGATSNVVPEENFSYDARGNLVLGIDAAGRKTFAYYDLADRKTDEVVAMEVQTGAVVKGALSHWTYDGRGNVIAARVYGDLVTMPATVASALPSPVNASNYRETSFTFDKAGRQLTNTVAGLKLGTFDSVAETYGITTGSVTVEREYDAAGNVIREIDGAGNSSWTWFDKAGNQVARVDRENYLTVWERDSDGNATRETRYDHRISGTFGHGNSVTELKALAGATAADRVTEFAYDKVGNRTAETRLNVAISTVSSTGALGTTTGSSAITYGYNGLGQVTRRTEATGDTTHFTYDEIGRLSSVKDPAMVDKDAATVRRLTETFYDALGNVARVEVNKEGGASAADRVTKYIYGAGGRLASTTDAAGFTRSFAYDVAGRVVKEGYVRTKSDTITEVSEAIGYRYDLGGRLVTQAAAALAGSVWQFGDATRIAYNVFGEVVGKGLTAGPDADAVYQESFAFDAGGRIYRSTAGDGIVRFTLYDKAGNATLTIASAGTNMDSDTLDQAIARLTNSGANTIGAVAVAGVAATIATFDKRGQQLSTREPQRELSDNGAGGTNKDLIIRSRAYNGFGEVVSETDARGYTTDFAYNAMGRLIEKKSPQIAWTAENGAVANARPTETYYYDAAGRMVGVRDANANAASSAVATTRALLAGTGYGGADALVTADFHADLKVARTYYDVFRDARILRNELYISGDSTDFDEVYTYDAMGRAVSVQHRGNLLTDFYVYDGLGQRTRHSDDQFGSPLERTDYDLQGRVTQQIQFGDDTITYAYSWGATVTTAGLGTFGAWTVTATHANGRTIVEQKDLFGRALAKTDMGGHAFTYGYDRGGRMTSQAMGGYTLTYGWFNTGLAASLSDGAGNGAAYGYDKAGNRVSEKTQKAYDAVQNAIATYDALDRMTLWEELGNGTLTSGSPPARIDFEYDLAGNIRRKHATYRRLDPYGVADSDEDAKDQWYRYDVMNRMVVETGALVNGAIVEGPVGVGYGYDAAGRRTAATRYREHTYGFVNEYDEWQIGYAILRTTESYGYRGDGAMIQVHVAQQAFPTAPGQEPQDGVNALRGSYAYDAMGRLTHQIDWLGNGTNPAYERTVTYNGKGQIHIDTAISKRGNDIFTAVTTNQYGSGANYALGAVISSITTNHKYSLQSTVTATNTYDWWDGAAQASTNLVTDYVSGTDTNYTTSYTYGPTGQLASATIGDGRPRTVTFVTDMTGQVIRRDEADYFGAGDPHEIFYRYGGRELGYTGNNGTLDSDYLTSITTRTITPATGNGAFRFNATNSSHHDDFNQSLEWVNSYSGGGGGAGSYTARAGDTLQSIAMQLWGDASLWYKLAEANGLAGAGGALTEGRVLAVPPGILSSQHNSETFKPYDSAKALGDLSPTALKPAKKPGGGCGALGQILLIAIAVAVSAVVAPWATGILAAKGIAITGVAGAVLGGAIGGAVGSIASQAVGVATGIQDKFNWKGVGLAALGGAVGGGLGKFGALSQAGSASAGGGAAAINGTLGKIGQFLGKGAFVNDVARGVLGNVMTQGIGVAAGLQDKFSWTGVASAGIVAGVSGAVTRGLTPNKVGATPSFAAVQAGAAAGAVAGAAARSLITGTSFGDNLIAVLPDVIGSTIGGMMASAVQALGSKGAADQKLAAAQKSHIGGVTENAALRQDAQDTSEIVIGETETVITVIRKESSLDVNVQPREAFDTEKEAREALRSDSLLTQVSEDLGPRVGRVVNDNGQFYVEWETVRKPDGLLRYRYAMENGQVGTPIGNAPVGDPFGIEVNVAKLNKRLIHHEVVDGAVYVFQDEFGQPTSREEYNRSSENYTRVLQDYSLVRAAYEHISEDPVARANFDRFLETDVPIILTTAARASDRYYRLNSFIVWNPTSGLELSSGRRQSPALGLYHEVGHALRYRESVKQALNMTFMSHAGEDGLYRMRASEWDAVTNFETPFARHVGEPVRLYNWRGKARPGFRPGDFLNEPGR